jgi:menaquinone-dependent protoporphyrinogen oxidase
MKPVAVIYATREGQTERIARQVVAGLRERGVDAVAFDARGAGAALDFEACSAAVLAASVHAGQHEREMIDFVRAHRASLESMPTAFLSVTLSEAGAERKDATPEQHARFAADVQRMIDRFVHDTGWRPEHVVPVAGALRYSRYNFLVRLLMQRIARQAGGSTDATRDTEYTDWRALDDFVALFASEVRGGGTDGASGARPSGEAH